MALILEVKAGKLAGKRIELRPGQKVTVGRAADRSDFAIPDDSFMSGKHFSVEFGPQGCRIIDRKSSNGTFLNGAKITEAMLADGDEVRSGGTIFVARIVPEESVAAPAREAPPQVAPPKAAPVERAAPKPPSAPAPSRPVPQRPPAARPTPPAQPLRAQAISSPLAEEPTAETPAAPPAVVAAAPPPAPVKRPAARAPAPAPAAPAKPAALVVGCWRFAVIPEGWEGQREFGLQQVVKEGFPASVVATEEQLSGATLQRYTEAQVSMLRKYLREPKIEATLPPPIAGAEETVALDIRYSTNDNHVIFMRRIFARQGARAGALAITALEKELGGIRSALGAIVAGLEFHPVE